MLHETSEPCCGTIYRNDAVRMLLGDSWHPGGLSLTGQLAGLVRVGPTHLLLDVACGNGISANFLEQEFGCQIIGLDVLQDNAKEASNRSSGSRTSNQFLVGDSHDLPLVDNSFDAAILECTLSSFQNKELVLKEVKRVLKTKARIGISDVIVNGEVPSELKQAQLREFCVAGAISMVHYSQLVELAGFEILVRQNRKDDALEFVELIRKKLFVAQLLAGVGRLSIEKDAIEYARHLATLSKRAIEEDRLGYSVIVAQKK